MDDPIIYNFFKRKLGHDIAEILYELTRNYVALTCESTFIHDKKIRCRQKSMHSIENYIKIIHVDPECYVEFTMKYKLLSAINSRNRSGTVAHISARKMLANQLTAGEINLTNCANTILEPGMWQINVYAKMISAGKVVIDIDRCRLNVRSV